MAVAIEVFQVAYIIITAIIIAKESRSSVLVRQSKTKG
jgi:hypothetical protein